MAENPRFGQGIWCGVFSLVTGGWSFRVAKLKIPTKKDTLAITNNQIKATVALTMVSAFMSIPNFILDVYCAFLPAGEKELIAQVLKMCFGIVSGIISCLMYWHMIKALSSWSNERDYMCTPSAPNYYSIPMKNLAPVCQGMPAPQLPPVGNNSPETCQQPQTTAENDNVYETLNPVCKVVPATQISVEANPNDNHREAGSDFGTLNFKLQVIKEDPTNYTPQ